MAEQLHAPLFSTERNDSVIKEQKEITGTPVMPIMVGRPAFIQEAAGLRRTSIVLQVEFRPPSEICFETLNTHYTLMVPVSV